MFLKHEIKFKHLVQITLALRSTGPKLSKMMVQCSTKIKIN